MAVEVQEPVQRLRARIEEIVGPHRYKLWFKNATQMTWANTAVRVGVPNLFIGGWIEDHFSEAISQAAREVAGRDVQVSYSIDPVLFRNQRKSQLNSQAAFIEKHAERAMLEGKRGADAPITPPRKLRGRLEDFVVGAGNQLAYSVARSVVDDPSREGSPVLFYSACGLGKTHLLQAIANGLAQSKPRTKWLYASGEEFTNQFLYALREHRLDAFRHRFRTLEVLLLDDLQFIANKKATQEEFLHTFNDIHGGGKRVVLASDAHPKMIGDFSESLVNRLVSGMVVRIEMPDLPTRCEILRRRATSMKHELPEPVVQYIAERIHANVRELEGCLVKLLAYASLTHKQVTLDLARQALDEHLAQAGRILTVADIEHSVATFFGLTPADLHTSRKNRTVALARNIAMHLARQHTDLSFPEIARVMGNKNHTTVLFANRRIARLLEQDAEVTWQGAAGPQTRKIRELVGAQEEQLRR